MKRLGLFLWVGLLCASVAAQGKRPFGIEDLYRVKNVGGLAVSPERKNVAFTVTTSDLPRAKRETRIWMTGLDGEKLRQIETNGNAFSPTFSPDGKYLAYIKDGNLFAVGLGAQVLQLTNISTGVADPVWSPDSRYVAFTTDVYPECNADGECNKRIAERWAGGPLKARGADELLYRHWNAWKDGTRTHIFLLDTKTSKIRDLTPGNFDSPPFTTGGPLAYGFAPDGKEFVFTSNRDKNQANSTNGDLWTLSLNEENAPARNITAANAGFDGSPKYSPDGRYIAFRTQKIAGYESDLFRLALYDRSNGQITVLTENFRDWVDEFEWAKDSTAIYFQSTAQGRTPLYKLDIATKTVTELWKDATIDSFKFTSDGKYLFYIRRSVNAPTELYRVTLENGKANSPGKLTSFNDQFTSEVDARPAEEIWVDNGKGKKIHTFIVKPHNFDPAKKYPLILNIHGGPQSQFGDAFRGDWQVYPGAGYVVAFANPTGSTGYGQDFTDAIGGDWGGQVYRDLMKVQDALDKLPYVDAARTGAMGWSYGGYMIMWLEGQTSRYKATASMMGIYDLRSFHGATEELWFPARDLKGEPWNSKLYEKWSPSNYVKNFKTPCLVITGERDYRVPYTQSLHYFTDLQKMGVPSQLVVYQNAGHWPSWYEMALYYTAHLEWFNKYLGGGPAPWTTEDFLRNNVFDRATGQRYAK
jgi:dipeptidyl aminopeptidase/acylaminoacyl peptidase